MNIHKTIENYVWSKKKLFTLVSENGMRFLIGMINIMKMSKIVVRVRFILMGLVMQFVK